MSKKLWAAVGAVAVIGGCTVATHSGGDAPTATPTATHSATPTPGPSYTASQEQAIRQAKAYLAMSGFSKKGLIDQLSSDAGDGFPKADARFAVNHITVNWRHQAVRSAKNYLDMSGFSRKGLVDQLEYDGYTHHQAVYAAHHVGL